MKKTKVKKIEIVASESKIEKKFEKEIKKIKGKVVSVNIQEKEVELESAKVKKKWNCLVVYKKNKKH